MSLVLHKTGYIVDSINLYRVTSEVDGKQTKFVFQCLQTKTDGEIETIVYDKLIEKGYESEDLTPITWD